MPPTGAAVDGSIEAVAARIQARRESGNAPKPSGPPPDGMVDSDDDYKPSQNTHADDEPQGKVTPEQLRREALGEDEPDQEIRDDDIESEAGQEAADSDHDEEAPTGAQDEGDEGPELNFETLDELAELLGMSTDDFLGRVKARTVVDGEVSEVPLAAALKGHQLESSFTRKNQAFLEEKKNFEARQEQERTRIADHFAKATAVLNLAQQQLYQDFQGVNWDQLQQTDQAKWAAMRQQYGERQARLNQVMQATTQQLKHASEEQKRLAEEARESHLEGQHRMLMAAVPEWKKDETRRAKEGARIAEYLVEIGFTPEEIENCEDHRLILLGRAALGLQGPSKQKRALAEKRVKQVQNLVRPGQGQSRRAQGNAAFTKQAQEAKAALKKSGSTDDAAKALLARKLARQVSAKRGRRARV